MLEQCIMKETNKTIGKIRFGESTGVVLAFGIHMEPALECASTLPMYAFLTQKLVA